MKQNIYQAKLGGIIKKAAACLAIIAGINSVKAQTIVADFENFTASLTPNSAYSPTVSAPFQAGNATFQYSYDGYWSGGFAYTNVNDSITAGFTNLYGVRAYNGYTNSAIYVAGQDRGVIKMAAPQSTVNGFYITNITYAYKSMAKGDQFAKKFGGVSGNDPDFFKVIIKGYKGGALKPDSITFMLADFTFTNNAQDYILNTWQFVNTATIGEVDSIKFFMRSSDMAGNFINTPGFFAIDNFSTSKPLATGLAAISGPVLNAEVFPNPFRAEINIQLPSVREKETLARLTDVNGKTVYSQEITAAHSRLSLSDLPNGIYLLEVISGDQRSVKRIIKN